MEYTLIIQIKLTYLYGMYINYLAKANIFVWNVHTDIIQKKLTYLYGMYINYCDKANISVWNIHIESYR